MKLFLVLIIFFSIFSCAINPEVQYEEYKTLIPPVFYTVEELDNWINKYIIIDQNENKNQNKHPLKILKEASGNKKEVCVLWLYLYKNSFGKGGEFINIYINGKVVDCYSRCEKYRFKYDNFCLKPHQEISINYDNTINSCY